MFSSLRRYRIGYVLLALALLGVGVVYLWHAESAEASEPSLSLECDSCHADAPVMMATPSSDPCDACHDESAAPEVVISRTKRDLIALENYLAAMWDNPLQKLDARYSTSMDQFWQAQALMMRADRLTPGELIAVNDLITQAEAAVTQLENESKWGYWRALDSPDRLAGGISYDAPAPIPLVAHTVWDSVDLHAPDHYGQHLELAALLVLSLCLLMVALRRAPPDDACNVVENLNLRFLSERCHQLTLSVFVFFFQSELATTSYLIKKLKEVSPHEKVLNAQYMVLN